MANNGATSATAGAAAKKRNPPRAMCPPISRQGGAGPNKKYAAFAAAHPTATRAIDTAVSKGGAGATLTTAHDAEAVEAMEKSGAKDDMGTLRSYDDEDGGGGFAATSAPGAGTNLAPVGAGWIVAVAKSDLLAAAKEIEAGASTSDVILVGIGGPEASDLDAHVQVRVSWHSNARDLSAVAKERIGQIQSEAASSMEKKAPDVLSLPPRFPDGPHTVAEILQQYEEYVEVDGKCYSPICAWGDGRRPKEISPSRFSLRLQQYCGAKMKGGSNPNMTMTQMKTAGIEWADANMPAGSKKNWKELAEIARTGNST